MPDDLLTSVLPGDTDPALTAVKLPVVKQETEPEASPAVVTHPDVWDGQGRLISHTAFTDVK